MNEHAPVCSDVVFAVPQSMVQWTILHVTKPHMTAHHDAYIVMVHTQQMISNALSDLAQTIHQPQRHKELISETLAQLQG